MTADPDRIRTLADAKAKTARDRERYKQQSMTTCRWCAQAIWLFVGPDGSLDTKRWTADEITMACGEGIHEPVEP